MKIAEMLLIVRTTILLTLAGAFLVVGALGLFGKPAEAQRIDALQVEHRFTSLETTVENIAQVQQLMASQLNDLRNSKWLELIALSGLLGETGLRTLKARRKLGGDD